MSLKLQYKDFKFDKKLQQTQTSKNWISPYSEIGEVMIYFRKFLTEKSFVIRNYLENEYQDIQKIVSPIEKPEEDFINSKNVVLKNLLDDAHLLLGRGRYTNKKMQRTNRPNKNTFFGEAYFTESVHAIFMKFSKDILTEIHHQGFTWEVNWKIQYEDLLKKDSNIDFNETICPINFIRKTKGNLTHFEEILKDQNNDFIPPLLAKGILTLEILLQGGFHLLTNEEKNWLFSSHFYYNKKCYYTENMILNGINSIVEELMQWHNFIPPKIDLDFFDRIQKGLKKNNSEDWFIIGFIISILFHRFDFADYEKLNDDYKSTLADKLYHYRNLATMLNFHNLYQLTKVFERGNLQELAYFISNFLVNFEIKNEIITYENTRNHDLMKAFYAYLIIFLKEKQYLENIREVDLNSFDINISKVVESLNKQQKNYL
ncbi:hypothetical protein [Aureivirga sp. CE67]|uniref:hypothetical protein n=1 Tax=Aureivirga sp. CE67 TaxID=1788983 RepID=UPI0018C986C7|nr:hypothetical protein [Aureivirga sp. CE67]